MLLAFYPVYIYKPARIDRIEDAETHSLATVLHQSFD